ncbi:MAG: hypothetical protein AAF710_05080 [Planctomycetota bacterium]
MPVSPLKRKEPIVKSVRRQARAHLDAAIAALTRDAAAVGVAHHELARLRALLRLVRRPLGAEVFRREHRAVEAAWWHTRPDPPRADDSEPPAASAVPDAAVYRRVADLAEVRMRARYWHLPNGGFELLEPGLRTAYRDARRHPTADTLAILRLQLAQVERAWPNVLTPTRKALRAAERLAAKHADSPDASGGDLAPLAARLFAETPAAFTKRLAAYWHAWRGDASDG